LVAARTALRGREHVVDAAKHDRAVIDPHKAVAEVRREAQLAMAAPDGEARVIAIPVDHGRGQRGLDGRVGEAGPVGQVHSHHLGLEVELALIVDVLPLAAATRAEIGAARHDAVGRGTQDPQDAAPEAVGPALPDLHLHALARQTERREDLLAVEAARRFAAAAHAGQLDLDGLGLQGNVGRPTIADCAHRSTLPTSTGCIHLRAQTSMRSMMPARS
jgi:hypothetical protein